MNSADEMTQHRSAAQTGRKAVDFVFSIRFRLVLWFAFILALVMASFSMFIYFRQKQETEQIALNRLRLKLDRLVGGGMSSRDMALVFSPFEAQGKDPWNAWFQEGDVLAVMGADGVIEASWGSLDATAIEDLPVTPPGWNGGRTVDFDSSLLAVTPAASGRTRYMFISVPFTQEGKVFGYILMGTALDPTNQLGRLLASLLAGSLITLAAAFVGGFWLADRAMRPVHTITAAAHQISETDLSKRLEMKGRDELARLANTFDEMLARLQAAFDRQRQFTADASHEMRTPLTIIDLEASRALAVRRTPAEYERVLKVIQSENQFMTRLVNNLLALARMDSGQDVQQKEMIDLGDLTLEVVERLEQLAAKKNVHLECGELPEITVLGDRQYLLQMLTNLIENAIKYSTSKNRTAGDKTALVRADVLTEYDGDKHWAVIRVSDNGPGIAAEHLPHLFDRFYRVDDVRSRENTDTEGGEGSSSGTGLGLAITLKIAEIHGGTIRVNSEPDQGSTFEAWLPVSQDSPQG